MLKFDKQRKYSREREIIPNCEFWHSVFCRTLAWVSMSMIVSCAGSAPAPTAQPSAKSGQNPVERSEGGGSQSLNAAQTSQVEVEFVSLVSREQGLQGDDFKASNIYSIASGQDPFLKNIPVGTKITLDNWEYLRDPQKTISMSLELTAFERAKDGSPKNMWWEAGKRPKVHKHTGSWAVGETFCKSSKDGFGLQWCFNYKVTKVSPAQ